MKTNFSTKTEIKRSVSLLSLLCGVVICVFVYNYQENYDLIHDRYQKRLLDLSKTGRFTVADACKAISCVSVILDAKDGEGDGKPERLLFVKDPATGELKFSPVKQPDQDPPNFFVEWLLPYLNSNYFTIVKYDDKIFFVDDTSYFSKNFDNLLITCVIFVLFAGVIAIFYTLINIRKNVTRDVMQKKELESIVQRDITEMIHHELNVPVAMLSSGVNKIYGDIFPCKRRNDGICNLGKYKEGFKEEWLVFSDPCGGCEVKQYSFEADIEMRDTLEEMMFNVDRINSVLKLIGNSKTVKNTNGNISLVKLLENTTATVNSYKLMKIKLEIDDAENLGELAVGNGLTNGEMLNIFYILINNALEARANTVKVSFSKSFKPGYINMVLKDNGMGIRDHRGKINNTNKIFEYGYSSKAKIKNKSLKLRIIDFILSLFFFKTDTDYESGRGIGLYINKTILNRVGGDIKLKDTSKQGTMFLLVIPVKPVEK